MVPLAYFKISYSLFRYLLSIIVFTLMLSTNGCLYFEYSTGGNIEEENIDYSAIAKEAMQKANEMSLKLEQGSEILHRDHPLVKEAKISIESIVQLYKSQKKPSYDLHDEYSLRYSTFEFMDEPEIQVIVLADDEPLAQILPNGKLYITSGLIDHDSPYAVENQAQLIGVLGHEFAHLRDGDILWQWVSLEARKRELGRKMFSTLTKSLPVIRYNYGSVVSYANVGQIDELIEYKADIEAIKMLEKLNYEPKEYAKYIEGYRKFLNATEVPKKGIYEFLNQRYMCMEQYLSPQKAVFQYPRTTITFENRYIEAHPTYLVTNPKILSKFEQYDLCAQANVMLSEQDRALLIGWLQRPQERLLNDVMIHLSASGKKIVEKWMDKSMYKRLSKKLRNGSINRGELIYERRIQKD